MTDKELQEILDSYRVYPKKDTGYKNWQLNGAVKCTPAAGSGFAELCSFIPTKGFYISEIICTTEIYRGGTYVKRCDSATLSIQSNSDTNVSEEPASITYSNTAQGFGENKNESYIQFNQNETWREFKEPGIYVPNATAPSVFRLNLLVVDTAMLLNDDVFLFMNIFHRSVSQ